MSQESLLGVALPVALIAAPFGLLALQRISEHRPWIVAAALTLLFWSLPVADALIRQGRGGANIGLGLFLLVSPLVVTAGAMMNVRRRDPK